MDTSTSHLHPNEGPQRLAVTVNSTTLYLTDPIPTGQQILEEAGFLPADEHVLIRLIRHGTRSVGLDEAVTLEGTEVEVFAAFRTDRIFLFTIDGRGYEWGTPSISEPKLREISGIDNEQALALEREGDDLDLNEDSEVVLANAGTEHFRTHKRFVTVSVNGEPKTIPRGTYTTEELICLLEVEPGYLLDLMDQQGQLVLLKPKQKIKVCEGMKFVSQVPCGGSS